MEHLNERHLIIRADASTQIGTGHLMRCLALAQAWKDTGGKVAFITVCQSEGLLQRLREEEFDIYPLTHPYPDSDDWNYTRDILAANPTAWVVLDGYHFDEVYQQRVKESRHDLLVIDDMAHLKHYYADIVLNQNLHAPQLHYSGEPYTRLLLGTRYVLLRREFLSWKDWRRDIPEVAKRILVTLGGSDPENYTLKVTQALQKVEVPGLEVTIIVGASNPHTDILEAGVRQSHFPVSLICDTKNMPELMVKVDVVVCGAGTTTWELAFLGTPIIALILSDNQRLVAEQIEAIGLGKALTGKEISSTELLIKEITLLIKDAEFRRRAAAKGRQLVDGQGPQRVLAALKEANRPRLRLRPAAAEDCRQVWEWANDPVVRAASFSSEPIPWEDHVKWFETKLHSPGCFFNIVLDDKGIPVGHVRFEVVGSEAEINMSVGSRFRGKGYGAEAIQIASELMLKKVGVSRLCANIKQYNVASIRAFKRAGYRQARTELVKGHEALLMILEKDDASANYNSN